VREEIEPYLVRERAELDRRLRDGEILIEVEPAGIGFFRPGLLAVTDCRLIHLYFRRLIRRFKFTEFAFDRIDWVELHTMRSAAELRFSIDVGERLFYLPIGRGLESAERLVRAIHRECPRLAE
jgi:hypothetical protein